MADAAMLIPADTFTPWELSFFGDTQEAGMTSTAVIERPTVTRNSLLGQTTIWVYHATLPCLLESPSSASEKMEGGVLLGRILWKIQFPVGSDILPTDRATIDGLVYQLIETTSGQTDASSLTAYAFRLR